MKMKSWPNKPPLVIGGIGGSGTRLVAKIISTLGYHMGVDLNEANDNLWFTFLFRHYNALTISVEEFQDRLQILVNATFGLGENSNAQRQLISYLRTSFQSFPKRWYDDRAESLLNNGNFAESNKDWGWKEPNSHMFLDHLISAIPDFKYIHVIRNGLDMAWSDNQNQLRLWGRNTIGTSTVNPINSLKFWCEANRRAIHKKSRLGNQFYLLNFDHLCQHASTELENLLDFLDTVSSESQVSKCVTMIQTPASMGRFRKYKIGSFPKEDLLYVKSLGFNTGDE